MADRRAHRAHPGADRAHRVPCEGRTLLALLVLFSLTVGCDSTAPENGRPPLRPLPVLSAPDSALASLELGLVTKQLLYYRHAIAETTVLAEADFHAAFDPRDVASFELATGVTPSTIWSSAEEEIFFIQFVSLWPLPYTVRFFPDSARADQRGPDEAVLYRRYRVHAGAVLLTNGMADLTLRRLGAVREWKIVHWADARDSSEEVQTFGLRRLHSRLR